MPPGRVQQGVVHLKRIEDEISWNKTFAAERQRAIVHIKPTKIACWQARALQHAGSLAVAGHAKRDVTNAPAEGKAEVVERIVRKLMRVPGSEIAVRTVKGGREATNSRGEQLAARHVAGCQVGVPAGKNFVLGINVVVHSDKVLVRSIGFRLRRLRLAGEVGGARRCETCGSGKILKEHRRQTARRRQSTGVRGLANHFDGSAIRQP